MPSLSQSHWSRALVVKPIVKNRLGNIKFTRDLRDGFTFNGDEVDRLLLKLKRVASGYILSLLEV